MRFGFVLLTAGFLTACALSAAAQAPRPINALPPSVSASSPVPPVGVRWASEPDTTAPWRYYLLAVGNVWEYEDDEGNLKRSTVEEDTVALGHRYFVVRDEFAEGGAVVHTVRTPLRYDTASATVRFLRPGDAEREVPPADVAWIRCPFDAPFGAVVECEGDGPNVVSGGYDRALVFGGGSPGTVWTAVKTYVARTGFETRYAAGVGVAFESGDGFFRALTYYRVGGEEHGERRFPVVSEPGGPEPLAVAIDVWPNPSRGQVTVSVRLPSPSSKTVVAVYDTLGREVSRLAYGPLGAGWHPLALDGRALPVGVYVVRAVVAGEGGASEEFVRRLTLVR